MQAKDSFHITTKKISHTRSFSNTIKLKKSASTDKKLLFLQSSRFYKKVEDKLPGLLSEKLKFDSIYINDIKNIDSVNKDTPTETHQDIWFQECVKLLGDYFNKK